jgi:hypothetical protein
MLNRTSEPHVRYDARGDIVVGDRPYIEQISHVEKPSGPPPKSGMISRSTTGGSRRARIGSKLSKRAIRSDAEVQRFLQSAVAGGAALLERRFRDGISAGEIPSDFPVAARAIQVTDLARGLTMRAQLSTPRKTLLKDADEAADLVLLPRRV